MVGDSGVVNEDVNGSEFPDGEIYHSLDVILFADIGLERRRFQTHTGKLFAEPRGTCGITVIIQADLYAFFGHPLRDGAADATASSGNQGRFPACHSRSETMEKEWVTEGEFPVEGEEGGRAADNGTIYEDENHKIIDIGS